MWDKFVRFGTALDTQSREFSIRANEAMQPNEMRQIVVFGQLTMILDKQILLLKKTGPTGLPVTLRLATFELLDEVAEENDNSRPKIEVARPLEISQESLAGDCVQPVASKCLMRYAGLGPKSRA